MNNYTAQMDRDAAYPPADEEYRGAYDTHSDVHALEQVWRAIRQRWIAILAIMAVTLILGVIITLLMVPQYTADTRIQINRDQDNVTNVEGVERDDSGQNLEFYETQYALLEARSLAKRVTRALNLTANPVFVEMMEEEAAQGADGTPVTAQERGARGEKAADVLLNNIFIDPVRGSRLIDISFTSPDPQLSANVANAWVEQFIASELDRRFTSTAAARNYLEERLSDIRQRLEDSERSLVTYGSQKTIVPIASARDSDGRTTTSRTLVSAKLEALNEALAEATEARIEAESKARAGDATGSSLVTNPTISALRQRRAELAAERARLQTQFADGYPTIQALNSQIEAIDSNIAAEASRLRGSTASDYSQAIARENELRQQVESLRAEYLDEQRDSIQYNIFQREVDTNRQLYDSLLQRYKEIGVASVGSTNISIVDRATVPRFPSSPNLVLNLAIAVLLGAVLAAIYVFAREQLDQSLKSPEDMRNALDLNLLGAIPQLEGEDVWTALEDRKSSLSEAYFTLVTNLSFASDRGIPKVFMFTSTRPSEGKSTSSIATSITLGRKGRKTLLIDSDMRKPVLATHFGLKDIEGLSNILAGEDDYQQFVHPTGFENLSIIGAGPQPPNPSELLGSDRLGELLERLSAEYDHIIIDSPPLLNLADAVLLASATEGLVLVTEANGAKVRAIRAAIQRLKMSHAHIFGGVITKLTSRNDSYGYGYGYGYSYGHGDDAKASG